MTKLPAPLTKETSGRIFNKWIDIIKRNESVSVVNLSKREQYYRLNQFLKTEAKKFTQFQFITLDSISEGIEDSDDLFRFLEKNVNNTKKVALFIIDSDNLLAEKPQLLSCLDQLRHQNAKISLLYFFNKNITYPWQTTKLARFGSLYQNLQFHRFYEEPDQLQFISYLQKKFAVNLPEETVKKIINACAGKLWLIKEAVRYYAKTKNNEELFTHPEMTMRLTTIFEEFQDIEKHVLEKIIRQDHNFNEEEKLVLAYFQRINFILSPLLSDFIKKELARKTEISCNQKGQILVNDVITDGLFSRREKRLLKNFITHPEKIISREQAALYIWGEKYQEEYSDWALDQVIRRLRNKLLRLGLSRELIKTKKNQGFYLMINK